MNFIITLKLIVVAAIVLVLAYVVLNATLSFVSRFSKQLQELTKNALIFIGVAYVLGLVFVPETIIGISQPLIRLVGKIAPDFLVI